MIVLDVESSGVDPNKNSILSLGALDFDEPTNRFYEECRIWDGAHIVDEALAVNGFTREQAEDPAKQSEAELIQKFLTWATDRPKERTLLGHNPSFDRDFVAAALRRAHLDNPFAHRTIDTHSICWLHMVTHGVVPPVDPVRKHSSLNLDAALRYCGIPDEPDPHNGLTGALSAAEVTSRLAYTKKLLPEFAAYDIPWLTI